MIRNNFGRDIKTLIVGISITVYRLVLNVLKLPLKHPVPINVGEKISDSEFGSAWLGQFSETQSYEKKLQKVTKMWKRHLRDIQSRGSTLYFP